LAGKLINSDSLEIQFLSWHITVFPRPLVVFILKHESVFLWGKYIHDDASVNSEQHKDLPQNCILKYFLYLIRVYPKR
jgi:hypothetical protein